MRMLAAVGGITRRKERNGEAGRKSQVLFCVFSCVEK